MIVEAGINRLGVDNKGKNDNNRIIGKITTCGGLVVDIWGFFIKIEVNKLFDIIENKLFLGFTCNYFRLCLVYKLFI